MKTVQWRINLGMALILVSVFCGTVRADAQSLAWDASTKTYQARQGEEVAHFVFSVTNVSSTNVVINSVRTSCGCTVAKLPALPWQLTPGTNGQVEVNVDLRGKRGTLSKVVTVDASSGMQFLTVNLNVPDPDPRERNRMMASTDRQAVFRGECATCHVQPALGRVGRELYTAACGICHETSHRASMVPDLQALTKPTDRAYWTSWVRFGKAGSLMPAFDAAHGGPLSDSQIQSLVDFLDRDFRPRLVLDLGNPFEDLQP